MSAFLMISVAQCQEAMVPSLVAAAAVIPADTARAIVAALVHEREAVEVIHQDGFDCLIDNIERALGEPHAAAMRALVGGGYR